MWVSEKINCKDVTFKHNHYPIKSRSNGNDDEDNWYTSKKSIYIWDKEKKKDLFDEPC